MRKLLHFYILLLLSVTVYAQDVDKIKNYVSQGVALHDQGAFKEAIAFYDKALAIDETNVIALYEKSFSLISLQDYEGAISCSKKAIQANPDSPTLRLVYTTYGNALDGLEKPIEALTVYDEAIAKFPDYYQLYFNKAITLTNLAKYDDAIEAAQHAATLEPNHASSHNVIARLLGMQEKNIPSLLAFTRFLIIEPQGNRANANFPFVQKIMKGNVEQTGEKQVNINVNAAIFSEDDKEKPSANNFSQQELILTLTAALAFDATHKNSSEIDLFIERFTALCESLKEVQEDNFGFYWSYYVPYFIEMNDKHFIETFAHLVYATSGDEEIQQWLQTHDTQLKDFYTWSNNYTWPK